VCLKTDNIFNIVVPYCERVGYGTVSETFRNSDPDPKLLEKSGSELN
jgi:hypothetical protein